ncbi:hypothetical protein AMS68_007729 [Peltaster fructicola]|uniref:NACHT domain-containing protein n=1 Tax=Peltaster fructicola TaxID=286661 RepID=A0A6H0Y598_9PEZI|nr:hypothetical protein AMS68_007729 [Peltaster fructicola]
MDPFSALNVACAVVQFVGFASQILKAGYDKHHSTNGATAADMTIEALTIELQTICEDLLTSPTTTDDDLLSDDERTLQKVVHRCKSKAEELEDLLHDVRVRNDRLHKGLDSIRQAIRREIKSGKIESLQKELDQIQQEVNTVLLAIIRDGQSRLMSTLDEMKRRSLRLEIENGTQLDDMRDHLVHSIEEYKEQTMDGVETILGNIQSLRRTSTNVTQSQLILSSLRFPEMPQRHHTIRDAHAGTFDWILESDKTNFPAWLTSSSDVFWITGKPGSGKSTLMKYLESNRNVLELLESWAQQDNVSLVTASFYFWHSGSSLQRSQEGMLRSLLFQILRKCPDIMPEVLPELWSQSVSDLTIDGITWTYGSLLDAFRAFAGLAKSRTSAKFCFFIDGLDEYGEDPADLQPTLELVMRSEYIKLCISSRPWPELKPIVKDDPHHMLVIQRYTKVDIALFVNSLLSNDTSFQRLADRDASALVREIIEKADGVFLWVFLVVKSLLRGLRNGDDMATLHRRLAKMPRDLNSFFDRMLDSTEQIYKKPAAALLLTASRTRSLPLITFRYLPLEMETPDAVLSCHAPQLQDNDTEAQAMLKEAENYIAACCRDLMELHYVNYDEPYGWLGSTANFTHRTVGEYLNQKEVQRRLVEHLTVDASFNAWRFITQVYIMQAKSVPLDEKASQSRLLLDTAERAVEYAGHYETATKTSAWPLVQELARVDDHKLFVASKESRQGWVHRLTPRLYFAVVLIRSGLALSIRDMMSDASYGITPEDSRELLVSLFHNGSRNGPCQNFYDMAAVLIQSRLDFNRRPRKPPVRLLTAWEVFLLCCQASSDNYKPRWWSMARHMLALGANPYATVFADDYEFLFTLKDAPRLFRSQNLLGLRECVQPACNAKEKAELEALLTSKRKAWRGTVSHLRFIMDRCSPVEPSKLWHLWQFVWETVLIVTVFTSAFLVWQSGLASFEYK